MPDGVFSEYGRADYDKANQWYFNYIPKDLSENRRRAIVRRTSETSMNL